MQPPELPMALADFEMKQRATHQKEVVTIKRKVREIIISDIQDTLHDRYTFYINEPEEYLNSELQRLLIRIDFMFNSFVRECMVTHNVRDYADFFRNFTLPVSQSDTWLINNYPMLILNLCVNKDFEDRKKRHAKDKKKGA